MPNTVVPNPTGDQLLAFGALLGRSGRVIESEISGGSMGNALPSGSRIRIRPLPKEEYCVGQVVAFVAGGTLFAHRILYRGRQGVLTRGDTHSWSDLPVPMGAILGVVSECLVDGKWLTFQHSVPVSCDMRKRHGMIETMLSVCMLLDMRLARRASKTLMRLARWRRLLLADAAPTL
jgi:hypothetical protein